MRFKENMTRRDATDEEVATLKYPKDKFDLVSVDYVDEWDSTKVGTSVDDPNRKNYVRRDKSVHITVRCKKCGFVKHNVTDRSDMSCKTGPCMPTWNDLTGRKFGNLTVMSLATDKTKKGKKQYIWYWKCLCDCGDVCYKTSTSLTSHFHRACKKCARKRAVANTTLPDGLSKWHRMIRVYKRNAKLFNREFNLTEEQFIATAKGACEYCGAPPVAGSYGIKCNGIDRIDASKGYIPGNVVPCCMRCNYMKSKLTIADFKDHVRRIYDHCNLGSKLNDHSERKYTSSEVEMGISL